MFPDSRRTAGDTKLSRFKTRALSHHRARAALLLGLAEAIPVIVDKDNVAEVRGCWRGSSAPGHRRGGMPGPGRA